MSHTVARVKHNASGATRGIPARRQGGKFTSKLNPGVSFFFSFFVFNLYLQTENSLHGDEERWHVEGLEEHLSCFLPVLARV